MKWPEADRVAQKIIPAEVSFLLEAINRSKRGIAIQAGGNVGVYPLFLSDYFDLVLTFEPEAANFECLEFNLSHKDNIIATQAALGETLDRIGMNICQENCGAHTVSAGDDFPMLTIDSLNVDCDLIQLDIEGFELNALKGAVKTIETCSPVIMIEDNGLSERYGSPRRSVLKWLEERGYSLAAGNQTDYVLVKNGPINIY